MEEGEEEGEKKRSEAGDGANTKRDGGRSAFSAMRVRVAATLQPRLPTTSLHLPRLGRTRGNGRVVQLLGVTCILHPTRAALTR